MSGSADLDSRLVRQHFSNHATEYDRYAQVQQRVIKRLVDALPVSLPSGRLLDIGCGTGGLATALGELSPQLQPVLCDHAHGMTHYACSRLSTCLATDADAQSLPLVDDCCVAAVSSSVYQWIDDLPRAFDEVQRVLQAGGLFAFALFGERSLFELRQSHRQAVAEVGRGQTSHVQNYPSIRQVGEALDLAGLQIERLWLEDEVEEHADVTALLRALKKIGAGNASRRRPAGLASRQVMTRMMELYQQRFGQRGMIPATYQVIFGLAWKKGEA